MIDLEKAVKVPGWHSRPDAAREKGIKSLGKTDMRARHNVFSPAPSSAPSNTKMRPYAKGGYAHTGEQGKRIATENHRPHLGHGEKVRKPIMDTLAKKGGGKCYAKGGAAIQGEKGPALNHGGKHHKGHGPHMNFGGDLNAGLGWLGKKVSSMYGRKKGGKICRAEGGEMEEGDMQRGTFAGREPRSPGALAARMHSGSHAPQMGRHRGTQGLIRQQQVKPKVLGHEEAGKPMHTLKRGGHHHKHHKFAKGGYAHGGHHEEHHMPHMGWGGGFGNFMSNIPILGSLTKMIGMKKGGHAHGHHHKRGHHMKKSHGGNIYERQMNGEKRNGGHDNYESAMRGEHAVAKPKMAIGGVGKIRHNQATASGAPKAPRSKSHR